MRARAREAIAPLYLLCCLFLANAPNSWTLMVLELSGLALLVWAALEPVSEPLGRAARQLLMLAAVALVVIALQLVPLPLFLWQHLGGRQGFATDFRMLGLRLSALPLSLTPYETLDGVLKLIPPLALVCAIVRLRAYRPIWLAAALLAGTVASIVLGAIHAASSDHGSSILSTVSHGSILAAVSLPFAVALFVSEHGASRLQMASKVALAIATLIILAGVVLNHLLAGFGLALSILVASVLLLVGIEWRRSSLLFAGALLAVAVALISMAAIRQQVPRYGIGPSIEGRAEVLKAAGHATADFMPFGSGLGSFPNVYRLYENPDPISTGNITHAHDDYLEIALELGLPGILLLVGFLSWWMVVSVRAWREADTAPFARAASFATALILVDSLIDFPLRTAAISMVFAMCVALLADRRRSRSELWPTRHVVLE